MDKFLVLIRGIVRPTVTWGGFYALVLMIFRGIDVPKEYWVIVTSMIAYWFASRSTKGP